MSPPQSGRVIEYRDEVIVEIHDIDDLGEIDVVSYQFDFMDDGRTVSLKGSLDADHASVVREALNEEGFTYLPEPR